MIEGQWERFGGNGLGGAVVSPTAAKERGDGEKVTRLE